MASDQQGESAPERALRRLAEASAVLGGSVILAVVFLTCISALGRSLRSIGLAPLQGEFELVEAMVGFAVFAFLPLCQLRAAHAVVDTIAVRFGAQANRVLVALWECLFALALVVIFWRLCLGVLDTYEARKTSMMLEFPLWIPQALSLVPALLCVTVAIWSAWDRLRAVVLRANRRPLSEGFEP